MLYATKAQYNRALYLYNARSAGRRRATAPHIFIQIENLVGARTRALCRARAVEIHKPHAL